MQGKVVKSWLLLLFTGYAFFAAAQEAPSQEALLQRMAQIAEMVRTEMQQSPQDATPLFEELTVLADSYYKASHNYDIYLQVMSAVFQYYQWVQKSDSLVFIAARMHNEAVASGVQTLSMAAAKYMKAWAAAAKGRQNETMRWLEAAHDAGKERAKTERDTYAFTLYTEMLTQLVQGYGMRGSYNRAMEVIEEAEPAVLQLYGRNSQQNLGLLMTKGDVLYRLGRFDQIRAIVERADSVWKETKGMDPQFSAIAKAGIANMKQAMGMEVASDNDLQGNETLALQQKVAEAIQEGRTDDALKLMDQLMEMTERQGSTDIATYSQYVQSAVNIHLARRSYTEALKLIEHAEHVIDSLYHIDPYARRRMETIHATVLNKIGNNQEAMVHLLKAKQMYDLACDHGIQYYGDCIFNLAAICMEAGDLAYAKLYMDTFKHYYESLTNNTDIDSNDALQTFELTFANMYAMLGYKTEAIDKMEQLLAKHEGEHGTEILNASRMLLSALLMKDREWARARQVLSGMLTGQDDDMALRREMGLLICNANELDPKTPETLKSYSSLTHNNIKAVMGAFSNLERQAFWGMQANLLAYGHNTTLFLMPQEHDIVCQAYDNALYIKSSQDKQLHESSSWQDVARQLKADEVAIEFIVTLRDFFNDNNRRFGALILLNNGQGPQYIDL